MRYFNINDMIGHMMTEVVNDGGTELIFRSNSGIKFKFYHSQDCCEDVRIEDIIGDLEDLVGSPIVQAEEISSDDITLDVPSLKDEDGREQYDSYTWTFYRFATIKGTVTVRWLGTSNGYYSESVNMVQYSFCPTCKGEKIDGLHVDEHLDCKEYVVERIMTS